MNNRVLITGANGLLGQHLLRRFASAGYETTGTGKGPARLTPAGWSYIDMDITDGVAVSQMVRDLRPDVIVHAGAVTQVDHAEQHPVECWNVNVTATRFLLEAAASVHAYFLYVSSDFVFSGVDGPYNEESIPSPVNYYGSSKLAAERAVADYTGDWCIVRTVLVLGNAIEGTRSTLVSWLLSSLKEHKRVKVVSDQRRTPTLVTDLAEGIFLAVEKRARGIFHISGKDEASPYEIAVFLAEKYHFDKGLITPVTEHDFTQPAKRPLQTVFITEKAERVLGYRPSVLWENL